MTMITNENHPAVMAATERLNTERLALAEARTLEARLAARLRENDTEAVAAESAAIAAASSLTPDDDADAIRALAETRTRRDTVRQAHEGAVRDIERRSRIVLIAEKLVLQAHARAYLDRAGELAVTLDEKLADLLKTAKAVEDAVKSAEHRINSGPSAGAGLRVPLYLGRRFRHAFLDAGFDVRQEGPWPKYPSQLSSIVTHALTEAQTSIEQNGASVAMIDAQLRA